MKLHVLAAVALIALPAAAGAQSDSGAGSAGAGSGSAATAPAQPQAAPAPGAGMRGRGGHRGAQRALTPQAFVRQAAIGGMFEVESSRLALQKSQDADIKTFAQRMIDDHGKANDQLKDLAQKESLRVPARLNRGNQAKLDELTSASGAAFDTAYLRDQRQAHRYAIRLFRRYGDSGSDQALQGWAKDTLPTLQDHLSMLQKIKKSS